MTLSIVTYYADPNVHTIPNEVSIIGNDLVVSAGGGLVCGMLYNVDVSSYTILRRSKAAFVEVFLAKDPDGDVVVFVRDRYEDEVSEDWNELGYKPLFKLFAATIPENASSEDDVEGHVAIIRSKSEAPNA